MNGRYDIPALILALAAAAFPYHHAAAEQNDEGRMAALVVLFDIPSEEMKQEIEAAVRSQTSDLCLNISFIYQPDNVASIVSFSLEEATRLAELYGVNFVGFIRQNEPGKLIVHVFEESQRAILAREVRTEDLNANARIEAAAIMVRGYLEILAEGGHIGILPPEEEEKEGKDTAAAGEGNREKAVTAAGEAFRNAAAELLFSYSMSTFSPERTLIHGFAAGIGISPAVFKNAYLELIYILSFPVSVQDGFVYMEAKAHPVALGLRYQFRVRRVRISPGMNFVLEYVTRSNVITYSETLHASPDSGGLNVAVVPSFRLSLKVLGNADLFVQAGLSVYLHKVKYVYKKEGTKHDLLSPWTSGFHLLLGMLLNVI